MLSRRASALDPQRRRTGYPLQPRLHQVVRNASGRPAPPPSVCRRGPVSLLKRPNRHRRLACRALDHQQVAVAVPPPEPPQSSPPQSPPRVPTGWAFVAGALAIAGAALSRARAVTSRQPSNATAEGLPTAAAPAAQAAAGRPPLPSAAPLPQPAPPSAPAAPVAPTTATGSAAQAAGALSPHLVVAPTADLGTELDEAVQMSLEELQTMATQMYLVIQQLELQLQDLVGELSALLPASSLAQLDELVVQAEELEEQLVALKAQNGTETKVRAAEKAFEEVQWLQYELLTERAADVERRSYRSLLFNLATQRQLLRQLEQQESLRLRMQQLEAQMAALAVAEQRQAEQQHVAQRRAQQQQQLEQRQAQQQQQAQQRQAAAPPPPPLAPALTKQQRAALPPALVQQQQEQEPAVASTQQLQQQEEPSAAIIQQQQQIEPPLAPVQGQLQQPQDPGSSFGGVASSFIDVGSSFASAGSSFGISSNGSNGNGSALTGSYQPAAAAAATAVLPAAAEVAAEAGVASRLATATLPAAGATATVAAPPPPPDVMHPPQAAPDTAQLQLVALGVSLPHPLKASTGGEDAFFVSSLGQGAIGVADGVGGWAAEGVDPALYPRRLMAACEDALLRLLDGELAPQPGWAPATAAAAARAGGGRSCREEAAAALAVLDEAHRHTVEAGSCTVLLGVMLPGGRLSLANLGDCGARVVRRGHIQYASVVLEHEWNMPYQLSCPAIYDCGSRPADSHLDVLQLEEGDIVVLGSDGLWDNLWDDQLLEAVRKEQGASSNPAQLAQCLAQRLATKAHRQSTDALFVSPFAVERRDRAAAEAHMVLPALGGKKDDVTAVVAVVAATT